MILSIFPISQTGHDVSSGSSTLLLLRCREDLGAQIKHGQRARDLDGLADLDDRKVPKRDLVSKFVSNGDGPTTGDLPATAHADESKAASNSQQQQNVAQIRLRGRRRHKGISSGNQGEQEDEAEEEADE